MRSLKNKFAGEREFPGRLGKHCRFFMPGKEHEVAGRSSLLTTCHHVPLRASLVSADGQNEGEKRCAQSD
jgi:hypothetical protein